jgi:hypothetical protein
MKFGWETEEERLKRFMKIPPKQKLEWLREMNEFSSKYLPKKTRAIYLQLRRMK